MKINKTKKDIDENEEFEEDEREEWFDQDCLDRAHDIKAEFNQHRSFE